MTGGMEAVASAIEAARSLVVIGHVGPDGDALGAMISLARSARAAGKEAYATFGEPFVVPHQLRYLDQDTLTAAADLPEDIDLVVVVDCGDEDRLGSAVSVANRAGKVVVIDHHRSRREFGDVMWVDPDAAATAQMVAHLLEHLGWKPDLATAEALYTGIVTDTGRFQYSSTSADVHHIAAALLDTGVLPDVIGQKIYEESPFGYLQVAGAVLTRARLEPELALVWSSLSTDDLASAGIGYEQADGLIDLVRIAEEAQVACLLRSLGPGRTKGSLRSRGSVDVGSIAAGLGGGGHHNAAGFTTHLGVDETIEQVRQALR